MGAQSLKIDQVLGRVKRPGRKATHEVVAAVLREAITSGQLKANQPLPQAEIAANLQVSHIPVREALRQLESEGLVTYQANRGAMVSALSSAEIREIYEIRAMLETGAIRRAVPNLTAENLVRAAALLDLAEQADDGATWGSLDMEFHSLVYHLDDRPRFQELITELLRRVDRYWLSYSLMLKYRDSFEREHRALLAALTARDAECAVALLDAHLVGACDRLIAEIEAAELVTGDK
ncbi:MAG: GntR family transcriptional regulator [Gemmatimonadota bacterium]